MYLVIAEKPSVSRAIAEVIGAQEREDGYLQGTDCMVSWCFGHLAEYVSPDAYDEKFNQWRYEDLPIIPKDWKVTVSEDKKDQFYILKRLLNSPEIEYVVNACDAGREGELIFKHVYDLSGSKKPVKRLWISSLEDSAILDGMQHLRSAEEYRHLAEAAVCRSQADWLVGMNATRAYTTKYFKKLTVGRVQTPTLAMLVERAGQISNFQKEKYFNVELDCDGIPAVKPKIFDPDEAEQLRSRCHEDNVNGKLSDKLFEQMLHDFELELDGLNTSITQDQQELDRISSESVNAEKFIALVKRYTDFSELTPAMINEFIEKILVHQAEGKGASRTQEIEIFFNFVGKVEIPHEEVELTEEEIAAIAEQERRRAKKAEYNRRYMQKKRKQWKEQQEQAQEPQEPIELPLVQDEKGALSA